jgi:hypothetical protein
MPCRYYESVSIRSSMPMASLTPAHAAPSMVSPLLVAALVMAGIWAAVAAAFARSFHLTTYKQQSRAKLTRLWPFLAAFDKSFRAQFLSALRGVPVKAAGGDAEPR